MTSAIRYVPCHECGEELQVRFYVAKGLLATLLSPAEPAHVCDVEVLHDPCGHSHDPEYLMAYIEEDLSTMESVDPGDVAYEEYVQNPVGYAYGR